MITPLASRGSNSEKKIDEGCFKKSFEGRKKYYTNIIYEETKVKYASKYIMCYISVRKKYENNLESDFFYFYHVAPPDTFSTILSVFHVTTKWRTKRW